MGAGLRRRSLRVRVCSRIPSRFEMNFLAKSWVKSPTPSRVKRMTFGPSPGQSWNHADTSTIIECHRRRPKAIRCSAARRQVHYIERFCHGWLPAVCPTALLAPATSIPKEHDLDANTPSSSGALWDPRIHPTLFGRWALSSAANILHSQARCLRSSRRSRIYAISTNALWDSWRTSRPRAGEKRSAIRLRDWHQ